ncbi:MAG: hypothetical protein AAF735_05215 [Myxococcota bacterium]
MTLTVCGWLAGVLATVPLDDPARSRVLLITEPEGSPHSTPVLFQQILRREIELMGIPVDDQEVDARDGPVWAAVERSAARSRAKAVLWVRLRDERIETHLWIDGARGPERIEHTLAGSGEAEDAIRIVEQLRAQLIAALIPAPTPPVNVNAVESTSVSPTSPDPLRWTIRTGFIMLSDLADSGAAAGFEIGAWYNFGPSWSVSVSGYAATFGASREVRSGTAEVNSFGTTAHIWFAPLRQESWELSLGLGVGTVVNAATSLVEENESTDLAQTGLVDARAQLNAYPFGQHSGFGGFVWLGSAIAAPGIDLNIDGLSETAGSTSLRAGLGLSVSL